MVIAQVRSVRIVVEAVLDRVCLIRNCASFWVWYTQIMEWRRSAFDWNQARRLGPRRRVAAAAARALGLTQPTLSRQVAGLEEALGVTLFERTSRALLLTLAGTELLEHFRGMGDAANRISLTATGQSEAVTGKVVIAATNGMATYVLPRVLKDLRTRAPGLQIEIIASNETSDLRRREADIAIRHKRPQDENLFARRLRDTVGQLYASKQYLDEVGRPSTAADLAKMHFVGFDAPLRQIVIWSLAPFTLPFRHAYPDKETPMTAIKTLFVAGALVAAPGLALAQGCNWTKQQQTTMSCAPGTALDAETGQCVAEATS